MYKLRSPTYIKSGSEHSCAKIEFERDIYFQELVLDRTKEKFPQKPSFSINSINKLWKDIPNTEQSWLGCTFLEFAQKDSLKEIFRNNCILYFPSNRFQEPAWLNEENLKTKAEYTTLSHIHGHSNRKIIQHSPLHDNRNWVFGLNYDSSVYEIKIKELPISIDPYYVPIFLGSSGPTTSLYRQILSILRIIFQANENLGFGV